MKCKKCGINYAVGDSEFCEICAKQYVAAKRNEKRGNRDLGIINFSQDFEGYALYLAARGYGIFTPSGGRSTTLEYYDAVKKIAQKENMSFDALVENINKLVKEYAFDGPKKKLGDIGHNTWRSALNRFREFTEYIKNYINQ